MLLSVVALAASVLAVRCAGRVPRLGVRGRGAGRRLAGRAGRLIRVVISFLV